MIDDVLAKVTPLRELPGKVAYRAGRTSPVQRLLARAGRELAPERWIFVAGCYNSGTTLLKQILGSHPAVADLPAEGVALAADLPRPEEFHWPRMWARCRDRIEIDPRAPEAARRAERIRRCWSWWFRGDGPNMLEKSVANAARLEFLDRHFDDAHFVYVVRNGYAVAGGIREKAAPEEWNNPVFEGQYPIELCAEQWRVSDRAVRDASSSLDRFLQISYEELTERTVETVGRITDFLGIEPLRASTLEGMWSVGEHRAPIRNMNPRSLERLSGEDRRRIGRTAGALLDAYGYESR